MPKAKIVPHGNLTAPKELPEIPPCVVTEEFVVSTTRVTLAEAPTTGIKTA
jgi:hypothetical protein